MADRFSVRRSEYDLQPEGEPAHLIDFIIRGSRGAVKGRATVDRRLAARYYRDLGNLLYPDGTATEKAEPLGEASKHEPLAF